MTTTTTGGGGGAAPATTECTVPTPERLLPTRPGWWWVDVLDITGLVTRDVVEVYRAEGHGDRLFIYDKNSLDRADHEWLAEVPPPSVCAAWAAERALARFGAYVVRDWFRRTSGFQAADGFQLDEGALGMGVVTRGATVGYRHAPGVREAVARLLAPDGAGEVR